MKTMPDQMRLTDKSVNVLVANDGQGLILIGDFPQLNDKSMYGLFWVLQMTGGTTGGGFIILGLVYQQWPRLNCK